MHGLASPGLALSLMLVAGAAAGSARAQSPPVTPDDFVAAAGGSDQYEILAARVALVESHDPAIRAFAEEMIRDHTAATEALSRAASRSGLKPPPMTVGADQAALLSALQGLRGADFDRGYVRQQDLAHRQALITEQGYSRDGTDPNLRAAAGAAVPMIEHHLQAIQTLQRPPV